MKTLVLNYLKKHRIIIAALTKEEFENIAPFYKEVIKRKRDAKESFILNGYTVSFNKLYALCKSTKIPVELLKRIVPATNKDDHHWCYACKSTKPAERPGVPLEVPGSYGSAYSGGLHHDFDTHLTCLLNTIGNPEYVAIFATKEDYNMDLDIDYLNQPKDFDFGDLVKDRSASVYSTSGDVEEEEGDILS